LINTGNGYGDDWEFFNGGPEGAMYVTDIVGNVPALKKALGDSQRVYLKFRLIK
jgi:hypothetical protein